MGPQGEDLLKQLVVRDETALLKAGHQRSRQVSYAGWDRRGAIADFQVHPLHRLSGFEGLWLHSP